jgi:hypothetical protein
VIKYVELVQHKINVPRFSYGRGLLRDDWSELIIFHVSLR